MKKITSFLLSLIIFVSVCNCGVCATNGISDYDYNNAKPLIESHDVISFDIFDTLLVRPYAKPDDLFKHLKLLQDECGFTKKQSNGKGSELEKIVLQPHTENVELFNYAKSLGKKIIIVSDMYLHEDFLSEVLHKNGIDGWSKMYVSSDYKASKNDGKLFDIVLNDLKVEPNTILHIGDNYRRDCKMAKSRGMDYFWTPKLLTRLFEKEPRMKKYYEEHKDDLTASIIVGLCTLNLLKHNTDYLYNLGYIYAGPICYAYTKWLQEQFKKDGIEEALFVARDGYTFQKAFELIKDNDCNIASHYFYVPRRQYALCTLDYTRCDSFIKYILNYYKDKDEYLKENTPSVRGISNEECIEFLNNNIQIYKQLAEKEKAEYKAYLDTFELDGKRVALIDLDSFAGTSFKFLNLFLESNNLKGYLFWGNNTTKSMGIKQMSDGLSKGEFVEQFFSAPDYTTYRIENLKPIPGDRSKKATNHVLNYPRIVAGIIDFVKDSERSYHNISMFSEENSLKSYIYNIYACPSDRDKEMMPELKEFMPHLINRWNSNIA